MNIKIGFIGCGNMGSALARALVKKVQPNQIYLANRTMEKAEKLAEELGCHYGDNTVAASCDYVFLCVKPHLMEAMLKNVADVLKEDTSRILVTIAAGLSIDRIREMAGYDFPIIRLMPNTPVSVGQGLITYASKDVSNEKMDEFLDMMEKAGILDALDENLIDAASCVAGCGPAWTFQYLEALADGGVAIGLSREKALLYAAQMLQGSAALYLETKTHPGILKDAVCSPAGSTIQGVRVLQENGFEAAVMDAVIASYEKTKEMGKQ